MLERLGPYASGRMRLGLAHACEPLGVVEPARRGANNILTRRDALRENRLEQSVTVEAIRTRRASPRTGRTACPRRRTRRFCRARTACALRRACGLPRQPVRAAAMRTKRGRAAERSAAVRTNELTGGWLGRRAAACGRPPGC